MQNDKYRFDPYLRVLSTLRKKQHPDAKGIEDLNNDYLWVRGRIKTNLMIFITSVIAFAACLASSFWSANLPKNILLTILGSIWFGTAMAILFIVCGIRGMNLDAESTEREADIARFKSSAEGILSILGLSVLEANTLGESSFVAKAHEYLNNHLLAAARDAETKRAKFDYENFSGLKSAHASFMAFGIVQRVYRSFVDSAKAQLEKDKTPETIAEAEERIRANDRQRTLLRENLQAIETVRKGLLRKPDSFSIRDAERKGKEALFVQAQIDLLDRWDEFYRAVIERLKGSP